MEQLWVSAKIRGFGESSPGHWSVRLSGRGARHLAIRIDRVLKAPRTQVPDGALENLVYHELLHEMLPGQGHDSEFRELEALWLDAERWDAWLDTLHERLKARAERYRKSH